MHQASCLFASRFLPTVKIHECNRRHTRFRARILELLVCRILLPSTFNGSELDLPHRPDRKETRWLLILASRCRVLGNFSRGMCPRRQCHGQDNTRASLQNSKRNKASRHPRRKRAILTTTPTIGTAGSATAELYQNNQNLPLR